MREQVEDRLRAAHCERIMLSSDGNDAIERLREGPYDLAISALRLPDLQEWRLVKMIRSGRFCNAELPLIVIHDEADASIVEAQAREEGVLTVSIGALNRLAETAQIALQGQVRPQTLIIEDDPNIAHFLTESLSDLYRITTAEDGKAGFALWQSQRHDLVLLDMMLPGLSGGEVLERILEIETMQPIVILTGYGSAERHREMMLRGASEFIEKPVSVARLRSTCASVLRLRAYKDVNANLQNTRETVVELASYVKAANGYLSSGRAMQAQYELKGALGALFDSSSPDDGSAALDESDKQSGNIACVHTDGF
ncbi:MAG: response regulator [Gammaproteobacteria bacterium]